MARYVMTAKRRAALRKAQLASAKKRKRGGKKKPAGARFSRALANNTRQRRARTAALQQGKRPPKMTNGQRIRSAGAAGAFYGGIATLSPKGAAVGYAVGATAGAGLIGAQRINKTVQARKKARVKIRAAR